MYVICGFNKKKMKETTCLCYTIYFSLLEMTDTQAENDHIVLTRFMHRTQYSIRNPCPDFSSPLKNFQIDIVDNRCRFNFYRQISRCMGLFGPRQSGTDCVNEVREEALIANGFCKCSKSMRILQRKISQKDSKSVSKRSGRLEGFRHI